MSKQSSRTPPHAKLALGPRRRVRGPRRNAQEEKERKLKTKAKIPRRVKKKKRQGREESRGERKALRRDTVSSGGRGARGNNGEGPDQAAAAPLFLRFPLSLCWRAPASSRPRSSLSLFRFGFGRRVPRVMSGSGRAERDPSPRERESDGSSTPAGLRNISLLGVERLLAAL